MKNKNNVFLKFISMGLIMALLFVNLPAYSVFAADKNQNDQNGQNGQNDDDNNHFNINVNAKPSFIVDGDTLFGPFTSGSLQHLEVTVKNNSTHQAKDIYADISVVSSADDKLDVILPQGAQLNDKANYVFGNGKLKFNFKFYLNPKVVSKPYKLKLKLRFKNALGTGFEEEHTIFLNVENKYIIPSITVGSYEVEGGSASSQEARDLKINLQNNATETVKNLTVQLTDLSAEGIELYQDSEYKYIGDVAAKGSGQVIYKIKAVPNATGDKILKLKIKYYDALGVEYDKDWQLNIPTTQTANVINGLQGAFSKGMYNISPSNTTDVEFYLTNTTDKEIKELKLNFSMEGDLKFLTPYVHLIDKMAPNETKTFKLKVLANKSAAQDVSPLNANLTVVKTKEEQILAISGVKVSGESTSETSKPKIIIDKYEYGGDSVLAGKEFDLTVEFLNTSGNSAVRNVKVQFDAEEGVFTPVNATNSFFFKEIPAGGVGSKTIRFKSKADAKVKLYSLNFNLEYENASGKAYDEKGNLFTSKEIATINVKQELRLETKDIVPPMDATVGGNVNIETEFFNLGKSPLYNLIVKLEGDFEKRDASSFVGTFEAGKSEFFSGTISPTKEGENKAKLVFEYEDEVGEKYKLEKEFTFFVAGEGSGPINPMFPDMNANNIDGMNGMDGEMPQFDENGNPIMPDQNQGIIGIITSPVGIGAIIAAVLAVVAAFVIISKKKKKKALLEDTEDED